MGDCFNNRPHCDFEQIYSQFMSGSLDHRLSLPCLWPYPGGALPAERSIWESLRTASIYLRDPSICSCSGDLQIFLSWEIGEVDAADLAYDDCDNDPLLYLSILDLFS